MTQPAVAVTSLIASSVAPMVVTLTRLVASTWSSNGTGPTGVSMLPTQTPLRSPVSSTLVGTATRPECRTRKGSTEDPAIRSVVQVHTRHASTVDGYSFNPAAFLKESQVRSESANEMRTLFTTFPAYGHLHPMVPLAMAGIDRGDEVLVATGREFGDWVATCGLPAAPAGLDHDRLTADVDACFRGRLRTAHLFTTVAVPPMVGDLLELARRWHPDLIVHEESEYAAPLVASLLGVPCITHSWPAPARPTEHRDLIRSLLQPIWARHDAGRPRLSGERYLDACPPPFQSEALRSIDGVEAIRPVPFDGPSTSPPTWLDQLERPAAYVSLGTVPEFSRPDILQSVTEAAADVVASVVVTTGPNPTDTLDPGTRHVFVERYVPQSIVLPHVDVVVSHGGAGTTLGALTHGLPHVVVPRLPFGSQRQNAERVDALGIGIHVTQLSDQFLAASIRTAVTKQSYAVQAKRMLASLLELPSPEDVLAALATDFA